MQDVALLADQLGLDDPRRAEAGDRGDHEAAGLVELREPLARPRGREVALDERDLAARVGPVRGVLAGEQAADDLVGRPRHGGDRRDAEALVDRGAARVVDAGDDPLDLERLACDPRRHDVRVVAARHRRERAGVLDAGFLERVAVEAEADDAVATEAGGQAPERVLALVDDRDGVTLLLEGAGQLAADPPATHHDHVHACAPSTSAS